MTRLNNPFPQYARVPQMSGAQGLWFWPVLMQQWPLLSVCILAKTNEKGQWHK